MKKKIEALGSSALYPGDVGYDSAREIWNAMFDHRPEVMLPCHTVEDVVNGIRISQEVRLKLGVRCGGHSITGHSVPDGGLMLDLRPMAQISVDPAEMQATVQGGALLGALDRATQPYGLATTTGNVSHTGIGGLTLGGGMGWLARQYGLTCDNMLRCQLVTASGEVLNVTPEEHPDLLWALRGGGGNFGVVTEFTFQLHQIAGLALSVELDFPVADAHTPLANWRDLSRKAPREATFVAEVVEGIATLGFVWVGDLARGHEFARSMSVLGTPIGQRTEELSYLDLQTREDNTESYAIRRYWKGFYLSDLSDSAISTLLDHDPAFAGSIVCHGGAIADVPKDATAFSHRDISFEYVGAVRWTDPAEDRRWVEWARSKAAPLAEYSTGAYVNTLDTEGSASLRRAYSDESLTRLRAVKRIYDPDNIFRLNHNIVPY